MAHNNPNLPEKFAVSTANDDEYQAMVRWFRDKGYRQDGLFSSAYGAITPVIGISPSDDSFNNYSHTMWIINGIPILTYAEFHVKLLVKPALKIIGYKLLKDYPEMNTHLKSVRELVALSLYAEGTIASVCIKGDEKAGPDGGPKHFGINNVLRYPEFWEPIYQQKFKVGDYLTYEPVNSSRTVTEQIVSETPAGDAGIYKMASGYNISKDGTGAQFRAATPEEIEVVAKTILILGTGTSRRFDIRKDIIAVLDCNGNAHQIEPEIFKAFVHPTWGKYDIKVALRSEETTLHQRDIDLIWAAYVKHTPDWNKKSATMTSAGNGGLVERKSPLK